MLRESATWGITMRSAIALAAVVVIALSGAPARAQPTPAAPGAKLAPADIQAAFFNGQTFIATSPSNLKFKMTFTADGKARRVPAGGGGTRGTGIWKLSKDGFCTSWKSGGDHCFTVVVAGDNKWSVLRGSTIMATWSK
jgi:hypothetical protein